MKRKRPDRCAACGSTELVDAIDNHGQPYKGCTHCVIVLPDDMAAPRRAKSAAMVRAKSAATGKKTATMADRPTRERLEEIRSYLIPTDGGVSVALVDDGLDLLAEVDGLSSENTKLKAERDEARALLTEYGSGAQDSHYAHHDPKGTAGANCPACIWRGETNARARDAAARWDAEDKTGGEGKADG